MGSRNDGRFAAATGTVYFALPGTAAPDFATLGHTGSDWQQLGYMDNRMGYDEDIDRLVNVFNNAIEAGAVTELHISDKYGVRREYRAGAGDAIREWLISRYEPKAVEAATEALTRTIAEHAARKDGVTTPLIDGAL